MKTVLSPVTVETIEEAIVISQDDSVSSSAIFVHPRQTPLLIELLKEALEEFDDGTVK